VRIGTIRVREALAPTAIGRTVRIEGWVRTKRTSKAGVTFLEVSDGSSLNNLQAVVPASLSNYETDVAAITTGSSVRITGEVVESPAPGQDTELRTSDLELVGLAADYPLGKNATPLSTCEPWPISDPAPTPSAP
jgi:asparaginyl-tRNA synthetase